MQLSVKDAANLLNVPENTVYRWVKEGVIPAYHINGLYRFNRAELLEWATSRRMELAPEAFREGGDGQPAGGSQSTLADALTAGDVLYQVEEIGRAHV
jgi:PTS system nitrogen regulatory IIA component